MSDSNDNNAADIHSQPITARQRSDAHWLTQKEPKKPSDGGDRTGEGSVTVQSGRRARGSGSAGDWGKMFVIHVLGEWTSFVDNQGNKEMLLNRF